MLQDLIGYKIEHIMPDGTVSECLVANTKDEAEETRDKVIASEIFPIKDSEWKISPVYSGA